MIGQPRTPSYSDLSPSSTLWMIPAELPMICLVIVKNPHTDALCDGWRHCIYQVGAWEVSVRSGSAQSRQLSTHLEGDAVPGPGAARKSSFVFDAARRAQYVRLRLPKRAGGSRYGDK